jgi:hypothetical protein
MYKVLGIAVTWRRAVVVLLLLIVLVALIKFAPSEVSVRSTIVPVSPERREELELARWFPGVAEADLEVTEIARLEGSLWEWTGVALDLVFVQSGVAGDVECTRAICTSGAQLDHPYFRYHMSPQLVLAKAYAEYGTFAALQSWGGPVSGGKGPTEATSAPARVKRGYDRCLRWWRKEIIYVEGGEEPIVSPGMSLEEFCKKNSKGEYLVVIASLES